RPRSHGPRRPQGGLPLTRRRRLDRRSAPARGGSGASHGAGRVDRDDAARRPALLLRRPDEPQGGALPDALGAGPRRAAEPGLHPRDLGLLAPYAPAPLARQQPGAAAGGGPPGGPSPLGGPCRTDGTAGGPQ